MQTTKLTLEKLSFWALFITIILVPFFFIPSTSVSVDTAKTFLLVAGTVVSFSLYLISVVKKGEFEFSAHKSLWAVVLVPLVFFVSAILSPNPRIALFGYNLEIGTWAFITLGFLLVFLISVHFRNKERIFYSYLTAFAGFGVIVFIALAKFFFGPETLTLGALTTQSPSPLGSWIDLGVFAGAASVLTLMALEEMTLSLRAKVLLVISFVLSLFVLAVVNVYAVWIVLLIFSLIYLLFTFSFRSPIETHSHERRLSYGALALLVVSLLFVFNPTVSSSGTKLGDMLAARFQVNNTVVRPSLKTTYDVTRPVLKESPIFGSGPNTFDTTWLMNKPLGVNQTIFWNTPFAYGVGFLPTLVATTGILGGLLLLAFFVLYILLGVKALFVRSEDKVGHFLTSSSFVFSLFLWVMMLTYVPSKAMLVMAFVFTGLFYASLGAQGLIEKRVILFRNNSKMAFVAVLLLVALLVGNVAYAYEAVRQGTANLQFQKASRFAQAGDLVNARASAVKAVNILGEDTYFSGVSQLAIAEANKVLGATGLPPTEQKTAFENSLREAIAAAQGAIKTRPEIYSNWIALGSLYESLVPAPLSVEGAYESSRDAYLTAAKKNPNSPEPYYLLGRLEVARKDNVKAREYLKQSLVLKTDYAEAYYLLTQIEASENNVKEAIKSAQALALLAPQNAGVLFQLGLLEYTDGNYPNALSILGRALEIAPDYANAKYFYGLTLAKLNQRDSAIQIFKDLQTKNPNVSELASIISNLEKGKEALAGLDTPAKTTPPITSDSRTSN